MKEKTAPAKESKYIIGLYILFVIVTSFFTYFYRYNYPPHPFWDEPYHIASAEKYLHGVFFMEPHPPLGKLFIALGEKLLRANAETDTFINTDYARNIPEDFSFTGFRLFPSLFGWFSAIVFFFIFLLLTRSSALASIFSFLYIFDNAEIVHSRSVMLDSTLTFFTLLTVLLFLLLQDKKRDDIYRFCILSFLFGLSFALALATKVVALVLILLAPALLLRFLPDWRKIVLFALASGSAFVLTYVGVWAIHFNLGKTIIAELPDKGYYQASDTYKEILAKGDTAKLSAFPVMLTDSLRFVTHYSKGVPRLDLCKSDENGSPSYFWPFGARTINYRWEKSGEHAVRYMYLVSNPVSWGLGLLGIILAFCLLVGRVIGERAKALDHEFVLLSMFALYGGYMIAISSLSRVMYLYHYFLPLEFSFIIFAIAFLNVKKFLRWNITENARLIVATILGLATFASFQFFRPLSYYEPITKEAFQLREIAPLWELTCVGCDKKSGLVVPRDK